MKTVALITLPLQIQMDIGFVYTIAKYQQPKTEDEAGFFDFLYLILLYMKPWASEQCFAAEEFMTHCKTVYIILPPCSKADI